MAQISVLRNAIYMLRRHVGLYNSSPNCITSFSCTRRLRIFLNTARYCSDGHDNSQAFQQFHRLQPKSIVQSRERDERKLLQNKKENLSDEKEKEYWLPSQHRKEYEDLLLKKITSCITADEVFDIYKQHSDVLSEFHMLRTLGTLSYLVAKGFAKCWQLHENEYFQDLCQRILKVSRQMEVEDLVSLLGYLCRLEVPADSKHVQSILQLLRHQINDMDLRHIIRLEFLLKKLPLTPLSHGMLMAVPLILENNLKQEPLSNLTLKQLSHILAQCVYGKVRSLGLVLGEIYERGSIRSGRVAMNFLWSLLEMHTQDGKQISLTKDEVLTREILLKEFLEVVARDLNSFHVNQIETTLQKVGRAYENGDLYSYNEHFLNAIAIYCIEKDVGFARVSHITRRLLKMNYISEDLVDYVISFILQNPEEIVHASCAVTPLITAITTASPTNHNNHREALKILLNHKSLSFEYERSSQMPLLNLALDLLSVGYYHQPLLELFTSVDFLSVYTAKYSSTNLTSKQLLQLHQVLTVLGKSSLQVPDEFLVDAKMLKRDQIASDSDLITRLHQILEEPDLVLSGVLTHNDIYIDHLIIINDEGNPVKVTERDPSQGNTRIVNLDIPENSKRIAILDVKSTETYGPRNLLRRFVRVDQQLLEALGFIVVPVLQPVINQLTIDEKNLYIENLLKCASTV